MQIPVGRVAAMSAGERASYLNVLAAQGVPAKYRPFYAARANQFLKLAHGQDPQSLGEAAIGEILTVFGRRDDLQDWQFAQLVDAVRLFLVDYLNSSSAARVDWAFWKSLSRTSGTDHSSSARQLRPEELIRRKVRNSTGPLSAVRQQHEDLIVRLVTEIRVSGYGDCQGS